MESPPTPPAPAPIMTTSFEGAGEQMNVRETHAAIMREHAEPLEGREPTPLWLVTYIAALVFACGFYFAYYSGGFDPLVFDENARGGGTAAGPQPAKPVDMAALGRRVFQNTCQACHQDTGLGLPGQYPPLAGSEWVQPSDPSRIIRIVLDGLNGPITVKGQNFNNVMVPWRTVLSDQQIGAVLTHVRSSWGNSAPPVAPEEVKAIREQTKDRAGSPWSAAELEKIPLKG